MKQVRTRLRQERSTDVVVASQKGRNEAQPRISGSFYKSHHRGPPPNSSPSFDLDMHLADQRQRLEPLLCCTYSNQNGLHGQDYLVGVLDNHHLCCVHTYIQYSVISTSTRACSLLEACCLATASDADNRLAIPIGPRRLHRRSSTSSA